MHADYSYDSYMNQITQKKLNLGKDVQPKIVETPRYRGHDETPDVYDESESMTKLKTYKKKSTVFPAFYLNSSINIFVREVTNEITDTNFVLIILCDNLNTQQKWP